MQDFNQFRKNLIELIIEGISLSGKNIKNFQLVHRHIPELLKATAFYTVILS